MLMQGAGHAHGLAVVRAHHAGRQAAAPASDVVEDVVHPPVRLGRIPCFALHGDGIHRIDRAQLVPRQQSCGGIAPFLGPREIQHGTMPIFGHHAHHIGHRRPLVESDHGDALAIRRFHQTKPVLDAEAAMRGSDDHTRLGDLGAACRGEHGIGGREKNERVDVHLVEGTA